MKLNKGELEMKNYILFFKTYQCRYQYTRWLGLVRSDNIWNFVNEKIRVLTASDLKKVLRDIKNNNEKADRIDVPNYFYKYKVVRIIQIKKEKILSDNDIQQLLEPNYEPGTK